jgi:hypothetical protein
MGKVGLRVKLTTHLYLADRILGYIFNDMLSTFYVASNSRVILKDELGSTWKENICLGRFGK